MSKFSKATKQKAELLITPTGLIRGEEAYMNYAAFRFERVRKSLLFALSLMPQIKTIDTSLQPSLTC